MSDRRVGRVQLRAVVSLSGAEGKDAAEQLSAAARR